MKHEITINVSKTTVERIVACKVMPADRKHLDEMLKSSDKLTIIIPGDSVKGIKIKEVANGGADNAKSK